MDDRFEMPVAGLGPEQLERRLNLSIKNVAEYFPEKTGILLLVFDFGHGGGIGYISNALRSDAITMLRDWIARMEAEA